VLQPCVSIIDGTLRNMTTKFKIGDVVAEVTNYHGWRFGVVIENSGGVNEGLNLVFWLFDEDPESAWTGKEYWDRAEDFASIKHIRKKYDNQI